MLIWDGTSVGAGMKNVMGICRREDFWDYFWLQQKAAMRYKGENMDTISVIVEDDDAIKSSGTLAGNRKKGQRLKK